ncbi:Cation/calcium exchanger 1 [Apostasia shenzhenica]|uniref:Cation/calcium exchanger 1 n=1 Tax=Apostasia shenzhenica TaxID=1088818 RepID=A0A2H9ZRB3_9ASPA|nr:Cation/calcium exchanger 1 [Apostasia shenzhenica]
MDLARLYKAHRLLVNLSFFVLLGFLFFISIFSAFNQSKDLPSLPLSSIFRLTSSSPSSPIGCRTIESLRPYRTRGYVDYIKLFYCVCGDFPVVGYLLLFLWLLILFYLLGNTASNYFCPSLESLSRVLKLSPTIAGVTLLSLGNGAPDVFSSVVSFAGGNGRVAEVGLSSVLGGAFFVSSAVVGVISICVAGGGGGGGRPQVVVDRVGFVRDLSFLLLVLFFLLLILIIGKISILGAIAYSSLYILYVIVVSTSLCWRKNLMEEVGMAPLLESIEVEQNPKEDESKLTPLNSDESAPSFCLSWLLFIVELPLYLPRRLTIPLATEGKWSKPFAVSSAVLSPILLAAVWNSQRGEMGSEQSITIFLLAALLGVLLGIIAMKRTEESQPPKQLLPWLAGGFLMSVVWTYIVAGELVSLLVAIGHILAVHPSVLGVTVMAWGNSIGDLIANVAMAVNGGEDGAQIAFAGCYAGPIFNTLVGLGLSLVLSSWAAHPSPFELPEDASQFVIIGFLMAGLLWALVMLPRKKMKLSRVLGVGLLAIYSGFLCLRVLESFDVLQLGIS